MHQPRHIRLKLCLFSAIALGLGFGTVSVALAQGLSPGPSRPSIEVDLSVLNDLGGPRRPAASIPPGLFPAPNQATQQGNVAAAFNPPQPAVRPADSPASPIPANIPVVRPTGGPALPASTAPPTDRATGAKDTSEVRAPSQSALQADSGPIAPEPPEPVAPEPATPEPVAPEPVAPGPATPEPVAPGPTTPQVATIAPVERPAPLNPEVGQPEQAAAPIPLPELSIEQPADLTEPEPDEPATADGVPVPVPEALDILEENLGATEAPASTPEPVSASNNDEADPSTTPDSTETQVATIATDQAQNPPPDDTLRVLFTEPNAEISAQGNALISGLSQRLARDESLRLQIRSYTGGTPETVSQARRLSLDRALAVRSLLIERGVRGTRIDIRALGNSAPDGPRDRVDLLVQ